MIEQLSVVACGLALLLAVSLLIPTRKRSPKEHAAPAKPNSNHDHAPLLYGIWTNGILGINDCSRRSGLKLSFDHTNLVHSLYEQLLASTPDDWRDSKSKQLCRTKLEELCTSFSKTYHMSWCLHVLHCDFNKVDQTADHGLLHELGYREVARKCQDKLCQHGLVAGLSHNVLLYAVPYTNIQEHDNYDKDQAIELHRSLAGLVVEVNETKLTPSFRERYMFVHGESGITSAIDILLAEESESPAIRVYTQNHWHDVSTDQAIEQQDDVARPIRDEEDTAIVSPAEAAQLVAGNKKKPAAVCIKEEEVGTGSEDNVASSQTSHATEKPKAAAVAPAEAQLKGSKPATPEQATNINAKPVSHEPEAPAATPPVTAEDTTHDAVSANEIDELFAIARKRKENVEHAPPTTELDHAETSVKADLQAIQATVSSAKPEAITAEHEASDAKEMVTADDIAKLFAAAKAKG